MSARKLNFLALLLCVILLLIALYLQYQLHLAPCSLCIIQRLIFVVLALTFLLAVIINPQRVGTIIFGILTCFFAMLGALVAGRQVWLQFQPPQMSEVCIPGLSYLLSQFSVRESLHMLLRDTQSCRETWTLFGLTLPQWTLLAFVFFIVLGLLQIFYKSRHNR